MLRPTICVDGRLVGVWSSRRAGRRPEVDQESFQGPLSAWAQAIEAEIAGVARFEGLEARLATA